VKWDADVIAWKTMKLSSSDGEKQIASDDPPPFLRTWNRLYAAVIIYTCVLVLALYLMTIALNR
jgi:hypothetical protein